VNIPGVATGSQITKATGTSRIAWRSGRFFRC